MFLTSSFIFSHVKSFSRAGSAPPSCRPIGTPKGCKNLSLAFAFPEQKHFRKCVLHERTFRFLRTRPHLFSSRIDFDPKIALDASMVAFIG
jgi:hypothetical protein